MAEGIDNEVLLSLMAREATLRREGQKGCSAVAMSMEGVMSVLDWFPNRSHLELATKSIILEVVQEGSGLIQGTLNRLNIHQASIYGLKEEAEEQPSQYRPRIK